MFRIEFFLAGEWHPVSKLSYDNPDKAHWLLAKWRQMNGIPTEQSDKFLRVQRIEA